MPYPQFPAIPAMTKDELVTYLYVRGCPDVLPSVDRFYGSFKSMSNRSVRRSYRSYSFRSFSGYVYAFAPDTLDIATIDVVTESAWTAEVAKWVRACVRRNDFMSIAAAGRSLWQNISVETL